MNEDTDSLHLRHTWPLRPLRERRALLDHSRAVRTLRAEWTAAPGRLGELAGASVVIDRRWIVHAVADRIIGVTREPWVDTEWSAVVRARRPDQVWVGHLRLAAVVGDHGPPL